MFYETGCFGRVALGSLPQDASRHLAELPGEWLEFDPSAGAIVVRHIQPTTAPCLPTIAMELVRMLAAVPPELHQEIAGGELFVHTESKGQLVRFRVEPGGGLHIRWAHPDYSKARRALYTGREALVEPPVQRLNGCVTLVTPDPARAAAELQRLADTFEGLYPEGEFIAYADAQKGSTQIQLRDVNVDVRLLIERMQRLGLPSGRIEVSSFAATMPEQCARFVLESGQVWFERPVLWEEPEPSALVSSGAN